MDPEQHYNLQITGGNRTVHKAFLTLDSNGSLLIPHLSGGQQCVPAVVMLGQMPHTLVTPSSPQSSYSLRGPAGMGIYQLQASSSTSIRGFGSRILFEDWFVHSEGQYMFLRHKGLESGFWIAVPENSKAEPTWTLWWLQPSGATVESFENYVMVDIEVVKAGGTGKIGKEMHDEL